MAKFARVEKVGGGVLFVNLDRITIIQPGRTGSILVIDGENDALAVQESPDNLVRIANES